MQVMHDRVLLRKVEGKNKTTGGLFLTTAEQTYEAIVVKVGTGRLTSEGILIPVALQEGDRVLYNQNATVSVTINKEQLLVIKEEDVFAVIESE